MTTAQLRARLDSALRSSSALAFATRAELDRLLDELVIALVNDKPERDEQMEHRR